MRPGGGSAKGSSAERAIARMLSQWWYGDPNFLWRRPGSGYHANMPDRHTGDIVPMADVKLPYPWPWHVQCKHWSRARVKLDTLFTFDNSHPIADIWIKEAKERRRDLSLMLLVKVDRVGLLCFIDRAFHQEGLGGLAGSNYIHLCIDGDEVVGIDWRLISKLGKFLWYENKI